MSEIDLNEFDLSEFANPNGPELTPVVAALVGAAPVTLSTGEQRIALLFMGSNGQTYNAIPNDPSDTLATLARGRFVTLHAADELDSASVSMIDPGDDANIRLRALRSIHRRLAEIHAANEFVFGSDLVEDVRVLAYPTMV